MSDYTLGHRVQVSLEGELFEGANGTMLRIGPTDSGEMFEVPVHPQATVVSLAPARRWRDSSGDVWQEAQGRLLRLVQFNGNPFDGHPQYFDGVESDWGPLVLVSEDVS